MAGSLPRRAVRGRRPGSPWLRLVSGSLIVCALAGAGMACGASKARAPVLYVSPHGSDSNQCARAKPCRTIGRAVNRARVGSVIQIAPGSYREGVLITKRLTLQGEHMPVINAHGYGRGILISGRGAAGSTVRGIEVDNATYEGILALRTTHVTIANNHVNRNDRGYFEKHFVGECSYNGQPPGASYDVGPPSAQPADLRAGGCGEGIHLASTSHSRVSGNLVSGNTGGIYLTDESGPAAHNMVAHNEVIWNLYDCGITLASHSSRAVSATGRVQPDAGGVYDNVITRNISESNGIQLPGAGVLVAAAFSGSAAYGNQISDNVISGNGLPGVALHSHAAREDLNGNVIRDNVIGRNAIGGATGGPGDGDGGVHQTVGILIWSAQGKITQVQAFGNRISDDYFGIWTEHTPPLTSTANSYRHVQVPLRQRNPRVQQHPSRRSTRV
jgi:parallel beta-helix repeat protein